MTTWYGQALDEATVEWWRKGVRGGYQRSPDYLILVERMSFQDTWWMQLSWQCNLAGTFMYRKLHVNSRTVDGKAAWQVHFTFVHEFGHALGLNHTGFGCGVSIMHDQSVTNDANCSGGDPPWGDDLAGYHHIYG